MGQVGPLSHAPSGKFVHVCRQRLHHERGRQGRHSGARQAPPRTQHEHDRPAASRASSPPQYASAYNGVMRTSRRTSSIDTTARVKSIELHPEDRTRRQRHTLEAIFVLHHAPTVLVKIDDNDTNTGLGEGIVAVEVVTCRPFTIEVELDDARCLRARVLIVRVSREQLP